MKSLVQFLIGLLVLCVFGPGGPAQAATVSLSADANTESDWASDNLYRAPGPCATPGAFAKVGNALKTTGGAPITFADAVSADGTYCYRATAVDATGNESTVFSNKAEAVVTTNPPGAPPNLRVTGVTP